MFMNRIILRLQQETMTYSPLTLPRLRFKKNCSSYYIGSTFEDSLLCTCMLHMFSKNTLSSIATNGLLVLLEKYAVFGINNNTVYS